MRRLTLVLLFFSLLKLAIFPNKVHAYIDPGTGSYVLQLVLGFLFGGVVAVKLYWKRIKSFFANLLRKKPHEEDKG